ncbi:Rz1-like lysis system protein LysC [Erwinia mallotivora]|uniref:Rz1-like lysis system protein LysC n=1 Tax=Erwinia mallotivora TaxID=69222 RepID=UPI003B8A5B68
MLLTGCGTQQKPQVEYRTIKQPYLSLPVDLTNSIDLPDVTPGITYGDSVELNAQLIGLVGQCNIERAAIRRIESSRSSQ